MAVQEKIKDPFIYVEDNVLPADVCEEIIRRFEKNKHEHKQGAIGKGIDTQVKDSMDLQISRWMEFFDISCALSGVVQEASSRGGKNHARRIYARGPRRTAQ